MTDPEIILHGLRDRDDEARDALRRITDRCERAEASVNELEAERGNLIVDVAAEMDRANKAETRVRELEAELSRMQNLFDEETRLRREATIRAEKAEARVRELEAALTTRDVKEAIGRLRGVAEFFEVGAMSAECDGDTLADAIEAALAGKVE